MSETPTEGTRLPSTASSSQHMRALSTSSSHHSSHHSSHRSTVHKRPWFRCTPLDGVMLLLVVVESWNVVFGKKVAIIMHNYPFMLTEMSPLVGFPLYSVGALLLWSRGRLPPTARRLRWFQPLVVASLFALHNVLGNVGNRGNLVAGPIVVLLKQLKIPTTLLLSRWWLHKRYTWQQYAAAGVVVLGIVVSVAPEMVGMAPSEGWAILLLAVETVPLAVALVYIETLLKVDQRPDICFFWAYICLYQTLLSLGLAPVNAWLQGIPVSAIGTNLRGGARCMFLATNTLPSDQCGGFNALLFFLLAIPGGLAFNLCLGYGVALGSASYLWLVYALLIPMTAVLFAMPLIMGQYATHFSIITLLGLVMVVVALAVFRKYGHTSDSQATPTRFGHEKLEDEDEALNRVEAGAE